jgi:hypothetical protein
MGVLFTISLLSHNYYILQNELVISGFIPYGVTHSVLLDVGFNHYPILLKQIYENIFTFPNYL